MTTMGKSKLRRRYFSLIEIMIVVLIMGLITGIVGVNVIGRVEKAKVSRAKTEVDTLKNALGMFYADLGEFPKSLDELVRNPGSEKWDGPYLEPPKVPQDPWGEGYHYEYPGQNGNYDLYSYGKDKSPGGTLTDADIVSWE